jgi:hypothetical protein
MRTGLSAGWGCFLGDRAWRMLERTRDTAHDEPTAGHAAQ